MLGFDFPTNENVEDAVEYVEDVPVVGGIVGAAQLGLRLLLEAAQSGRVLDSRGGNVGEGGAGVETDEGAPEVALATAGFFRRALLNGSTRDASPARTR